MILDTNVHSKHHIQHYHCHVNRSLFPNVICVPSPSSWLSGAFAASPWSSSSSSPSSSSPPQQRQHPKSNSNSNSNNNNNNNNNNNTNNTNSTNNNTNNSSNNTSDVAFRRLHNPGVFQATTIGFEVTPISDSCASQEISCTCQKRVKKVDANRSHGASSALATIQYLPTVFGVSVVSCILGRHVVRRASKWSFNNSSSPVRMTVPNTVGAFRISMDI